MAEYKRPPHPLRVLASARDNFFTGKPLDGVNPKLLDDVRSAVLAAGGTGVVVTSAKRPPGPGNDVKNSNHITGDALDGYAIIKGKRVPIGTAIKPFASQYGLRSGDVPGFDPKTKGGYDPVHVDDGANVGGVTASNSGTGSYSFPQLERLWISAGGSPKLAPTMAAVALAESSGNQKAVNDDPSTGDYSVGLWQINYYGGLRSSRTARYGSPEALASDPMAQAKAAVDLAQGGRGLGNWSTYKSGAYKQYLSSEPPAATVPQAGKSSAISGVTQQPSSVTFQEPDQPVAPAAAPAASTGVVFPPPPARPDIAPPPPSQYTLPGGGPTLPGSISLSTDRPAVAESWQLLAATPGLSPETMSLIHIAGGGGGSQ